MELLRSKYCNDSFTADSCSNSFQRTCCAKHKEHDNREPILLKEEFRCTEMLCFRRKTYCRCYSRSHEFIFSSKGLIKRTVEKSGNGPIAKTRKVMDGTENFHQSWILPKRPLCSNVRADKERAPKCLSQTNS